MALQVQITTPEKLVYDQPADFAEIPGKDGYLGILPGHAALLSELGSGELKVTSKGKVDKFMVTGGYVEVRNDQVRVLADSVA